MSSAEADFDRLAQLDDEDHQPIVVDRAKDAVVADSVAPEARLAECLADGARIRREVNALVHESHE